MEGWFHARHEGQLDLISTRSRIRAEIPPRTYLGAILQCHRFLHRHIRKLCHKEEAPRSFAQTTLRRVETNWQTR